MITIGKYRKGGYHDVVVIHHVRGGVVLSCQYRSKFHTIEMVKFCVGGRDQNKIGGDSLMGVIVIPCG